LQAARQAWWARQSKARQGIERKELRCDRSKATQAVQPPENHQLSYSASRYEKSDDTTAGRQARKQASDNLQSASTGHAGK
ncbi:unnamed protein product, partial [Fusarium graminearum]